MTLPVMAWRLLSLCSAAGVAGGATLGLARGPEYLPTLPFAIIEGSILLGVPSALLDLVLGAAWSGASALHRRWL